MRNRVVIVRTGSEAKNWMESHSPGYVARAVVVDLAMSAKLVSGPKSRSICRAPGEADCKY
eukprot:7961117-Pyramimonas_sp.AAC.1